MEGVEWFGDKKALKIHQCCQGRNIKQQFEDLEGTMRTIKLMEQLLLTEGQGFQGFGKGLGRFVADVGHSDTNCSGTK